MGNDLQQTENDSSVPAPTTPKTKRIRLGRIFGMTVGLAAIIVILMVFIINSALEIFVDEDYTSLGELAAGGNKSFGGFLTFFETAAGFTLLVFILVAVIGFYIIAVYICRLKQRRELEVAALKRSAAALGNINLRYDNIHEITAVLDVLSMMTEDPKTSSVSAKEIEQRLKGFINASTIELPQTPETAAILDSLPAPDTPDSLAAALSAGATLRQAEDGQTLVLTTISGGRHILLTPIRTPNGIILCQQGVRVKTDIAPNIEQIGATSIPTAPEFFVGQPLEKSIEYPELPLPGATLGPDALLNDANAQALLRQLPAADEQAVPALPRATSGGAVYVVPIKSAPQIAGVESTVHTIPDAIGDRRNTDEPHAPSKPQKSGSANSKKKKTSTVGSKTKQPATAKKSTTAKKSSTAKKPLTDEQKAKRKAAAERKKQEREEFLASLSPEDRERYLDEEKQEKARAAEIRKQKRIDADNNNSGKKG